MPIHRRGRHLLRATRARLGTIRRMVRDHEWGLLILCALVGIAVGGVTTGLHALVTVFNQIGFSLGGGRYLSAAGHISSWQLILVPTLGGLGLGLASRWLAKRRGSDIVDPVEANALYGGRLSLRSSAHLTGLTLISNAAGASVGMEAGYSQLGAGIFASAGSKFRLRREDQRTMVTAGAAAAIAAAFNAPLTGAFYGFELIHGSYTTRLLAPVTASVLTSTFTVRLLGPDQPLFDSFTRLDVPHGFYPLFALLGLLAAGLGILTMQSATWFERLFRATRLPSELRLMLGGLILGLLALGTPQVLGSGHGAIDLHLQNRWPMTVLMLFLAGKLVASALSLGAGFRGGLFSSSLFLGALLGAVFVEGLGLVEPRFLTNRAAFMLVGMGSVGAAIIGAPFTMVFLVLESTGDFLVSVAVLVGVLIASTTVRFTFGYSFSTWRFHLRGMPLQGAHDIGWVSELTAQRLMRTDYRTVPETTTLESLRELVPLGSKKYVFAVDRDGGYAGTIDVAGLYEPELNELAPYLLGVDVARVKNVYLTPQDDVQKVLETFRRSQAETLPVVAGPGSRRILGALSEAYCLQRYAQEMEKKRRTDLGIIA